jgi:CHAT domain
MTSIQRQSFALRIASRGQGRASIQLRDASVGMGADQEVDLAPLIERYRELSVRLRTYSSRGVELLAPAARSEELPAALRSLGAGLYQALLGGPLLEPFSICLDRARRTPSGQLTLKLHFVPTEPGALELLALPWELLYRPDSRDFLARSRKTPLLRFLDIPQIVQPAPVRRPQRVLLVRCCPRSAAPLQLAFETARITEILGAEASVVVDELVSPSLVALLDRMTRHRYSLVHFMGHGSFDETTGEGVLHFEDESGEPLPVSGATFAEALRDCHDLSLVVLNACNTARTGTWPGADPFTGVASALVLSGVPAVLAMQRPVSDESALRLASHLYGGLARGMPLDVAVAETRRALYLGSPSSWEWATPALYARVDLDRLFKPPPQETPPQPRNVPLDRAFELLRGRRPGELAWSEVKTVEGHLQKALEQEGESLEALLLAALIKLDFHRRKGYRVEAPSPEALVALAARNPRADQALAGLARRLSLGPSLLDPIRAHLLSPTQARPSPSAAEAQPPEPQT